MPDTDVAQSFDDLLRAQIRHGFTDAQQYLAAAVYLDSKRLPQLAATAYRRSREQYADALRMVQYLLDRDLDVRIAEVDEIRSTFEDPRAAIAFLLRTEQTRSAQISDLARRARTAGDYLGERFVQWFLEEQVQAVATMTTMLTVIDRAAGQLFDVEEFIARESRTRPRADGTAPKMAGAGQN